MVIEYLYSTVLESTVEVPRDTFIALQLTVKCKIH